MWCSYRYSSCRQWHTAILKLIGFFICCNEHHLKVLLKSCGLTEYSYVVSGWDQVLYSAKQFTYRIVGFVYKVLICANYARCHGLAHFNSTVTVLSTQTLFLACHSSVPCCMYLMWSKCRYLVSRRSSGRPFTEQLRILATSL